MTKHITCFFGSPRAHGNSATIANQFLSRAKEKGAIINTHHLATMQFQGCQNLLVCKSATGRCGLNDDLAPALENIKKSDIVVLVSPIYFTDISGQLKQCLDRWYSFFLPNYPNLERKSRLSKGRTLILIQTQGEGESKYTDILEKYKPSFTMLGFAHFHLIRATDVREEGDINHHTNILHSARSLAEILS